MAVLNSVHGGGAPPLCMVVLQCMGGLHPVYGSAQLSVRVGLKSVSGGLHPSARWCIIYFMGGLHPSAWWCSIYCMGGLYPSAWYGGAPPSVEGGGLHQCMLELHPSVWGVLYPVYGRAPTQ